MNIAWLRLVTPREGESNRSRWDTDPSWRVVQAAPFAEVPASARRIIRSKQRAHNVEQLTRGAYGYLVSLVAQQVRDGEHWDVSRGIGELAEHLTAEAEKPRKDFGELVRTRRKERGLPVERRKAVLPALPARWRSGEQGWACPVVSAEPDHPVPAWEDDRGTMRPQLRKLAAERRLHKAYHQLEEAEVRQESVSTVAWYEAHYLHELELYTKLCHQLATYSG